MMLTINLLRLHPVILRPPSSPLISWRAAEMKTSVVLTHLLSSDWLRTVSIAAAAETHGGAAEFGQRHGRLVSQQRPEPTQLGFF